jgi:hypothetical protein
MGKHQRLTNKYMAQPMTQDNTGAYTYQGLNNEVPQSQQQSPYSTAADALQFLLQRAQGAGSTAPLYAQQNQLQNQALNLSNPMNSTPYQNLFAGMGYNAPAAEQQTQDAFQPGLTAISSQIQASNDAQNEFQGAINNANNIIQSQKNTVAPGQTLVDNSGNVIYQGTSFAGPAVLNTDPNSVGYGQPDYLSANGQWLSDVKAGNKANGTNQPSTVTPGQQALVGGVDVAGYNGNQNPNYAADVNRSYIDIENAMPVPTAQGLDSYIQNNAGQNTSPITGAMIMKAAQGYSVPPAVLAAVLNDESDFGTAGAGAKTNNPGNVQSNGSDVSYGSVTLGVNAAAAALAKHMPGNSTVGSSSVSSAVSSTPTAPLADPKGNMYSNPAYAARVAQLPPMLQQFTLAGPAGVAYIDGDALANTPALQQSAAMAASKAGIPILDGNDIQTLDNVNNIAQQMQTMSTLITQNLSSGGGSSPLGFIQGLFGTTLNDLAQTNPDFAKFNSYVSSVTTAATQLKALAGGAGSGLRITGAELGGVGAMLPSTSDSLQTAQQKISAVNLQITQWMHTNFPDVDPSAPIQPMSQQNQSGGGAGGANNNPLGI